MATERMDTAAQGKRRNAAELVDHAPGPQPLRVPGVAIGGTVALVSVAAWFLAGSLQAVALAGALVALALLAVRTSALAYRIRPLTFKVVSGEFDAHAARMCGPIPQSLAMADGRLIELPGAVFTRRAPSGARDEATPPTDSWAYHIREGLVTASPSGLLAAAGLGNYFVNARALDDNLLHAMEALSGNQVDGLADFLSVQDIKGYQLEGIRLKGAIGEQEAHDILADAGLDVRWPPGGTTEYGPSNNPGWDLNVEGTDVNVKIVADAGQAAREHFAEYPGIPLVLNSDADNIPPDALHFDGTWPSPEDLAGGHITIVVDGLEASGIEAIQEAAAGVEPNIGEDGVGVIPGLSIVVAAARSAVHEGRLLKDGNTEMTRALKNVAVDSATKGGGAMAGGYAGAQVGLAIDAATGGLLLGIPTLLGGLAGAVLGGTAGSKVANRVKLRPLLEAQDQVRSTLRDFDASARRASEEVELGVSQEVERQRRELDVTANEARRAYTAYLGELQAGLNAASTLSPSIASALVISVAKELDSEIEVLGAGVSRPGLVGRWWLRQCRRKSRVNREIWLASAMGAVERSGAEGAGPVFDHLMVAGDGHRAAELFLTRYAQARLRAMSGAKAANDIMVQVAVEARRVAVDRVKATRDQLVKHAEMAVEAAARRVDLANREVLREIRAAGLPH